MDLIKKIKSKKELSGLSDEFVSSVLSEILAKNGYPQKLDKKSEKILLKEARAELRRYAGQYRKNIKKSKLLESHISSNERMPYYHILIEEIKKLNPKSILDLGCGLNPMAIATPGIRYYASDINESDLRALSDFFRKKKIKGKVYYQDLRSSRDFPAADLTLILKVFDLIDKKGHKNAEEILSALPSQSIIVSFSTKKISGRPMSSPRRFWFENLIKRLNFKFKTFKIPNEIFYVIKRP